MIIIPRYIKSLPDMYEMSYMRKPYYPFIKTKKADDYFYGNKMNSVCFWQSGRREYLSKVDKIRNSRL